MGRPPCCDKSNVKRGLWTAEEDAKILAYVSNHGIGNWTLVPKKAGLNRCGKSCRLRWTNYLRPDLKHDNFTPQEEELIINLHEAIGSRWSLIAKRLPGRTDNDVKNYWNTKLRKKLMKMGIDPVTHKPVSQVLSDLGSISSLPNSAANQMPFVNKDLTKTSAPAAHYSPEPALNISTKRNLMVEKQAQDDQVHLWENQIQFQVFNEATSSCSSSSSSSNLTQLSSQLGSPQSYSWHTSDIQAQIAPPCYSSFDWTEFLLSDPFMCTEFQQQDLNGVLSSLSEIQISKNALGKCNAHDNNGAASEGFFGDVACEARKGFESTSSSSGNSFVDGILDKDSEMRAAFPELLDGSCDY